MSRCALRPSFVETAVRILRIDCAVRPSLPMTLPTSSFATRSSIRLLCSPAISVTTTWSGWSTSSIAIVRIGSFSAIGDELKCGLGARERVGNVLFGRGRRAGLVGRSPGLALEEAVDRIGGRCAVLTPVVQSLAIDGELAGVLRRVVCPDVLE